MAAITLRLVAATALGTAAFLLATKWKAIVSAAIIAGIGFAGILLYSYWTDSVAERRTQQIHDCAIAKVATAEGDIFDRVGAAHPQEGRISGTATLDDIQEGPVSGTVSLEDTAVAAAEKGCAGEIDPKQKSTHQQIEEYKHQHGIKK